LKNITHGFVHGDNVVVALAKFDLKIAASDFVSLVGPSGCGKTTVLGIVAGLYHPTIGEAEVDGARVVGPRADISYMLARDALLPWRTAQQNVELGLEVRGVSKANRERASSEWLRRVGLGEFRNSSITKLSQGMRQRVAIARTLVLSPRCVLMDEPFAALDAQTRLQIQREFIRLWEATRPTVVFVTHDLVEAVRLSDRVILVGRRPGRVVEDLRIELPRPRTFVDDFDSPQFREHFRHLAALLEREVRDAADNYDAD
jgi:NitT/TauT family transport system ATP-binding protein